MRLAILAVGLFRNSPEKTLYETYAQRLPWPVTLHEIKPSHESAPDRAIAHEGAQMLKHLKPDDRLIALDMDGQILTSAGFAALLRKEQTTGNSRVVIAIGGAEGLAPEVRARASAIVAFGKMTWPHMLMRPLLAEQLYRAWCIENKHPYHRD